MTPTERSARQRQNRNRRWWVASTEAFSKKAVGRDAMELVEIQSAAGVAEETPDG